LLSGRDASCTRCKLHASAEFVCLLGSGDIHADVMVIGEAPGHREDDSGIPFVGKAGKLLDRLLEDIDLSREEVFISNAVHCRPPDNRTPTAAEIRQCKKWIDYEIARVKPKYILLLGNIALQSVLGIKGIRQERGKPREHNGAIVIPTYHPASTFRDERNLPIIERDFQKLSECVSFGGIPEERDLDYEIVDTFDKVEEMLDDLYGCVAGDLETTRLYPFTTLLDDIVASGEATREQLKEHRETHNGKQPQVVSIQFATARKQWVIPAEEPGIFSRDQLIDIVDRITEKLEDCYLVGHNWKFDALWMRVRFGVIWTADFDTMLAHYLCDENDRHGLKELAQKYLGAPDWDVSKDVKTGWSEKNAKYAAHDVYFTRKLRFFLRKWLDDDPEVKKVFEKLMMPYSKLFTEVEFDGVYIDQTKMDEAESFLWGEVENAERDLDKWSRPKWSVDKKGRPVSINWGSTQQLARLMYEDLGLTVIQRTDTGNPSTAESVLLRTDHLIAGGVLKWRGAKKQLSSFIEGWRPYIDRNGYLHPSFKLHGTVTGRISCEHPGLQQVPRDKRIRQLITAPEEDDWVHLEVDLSQIELRLAADLANEINMLSAFREREDVHWRTMIHSIGSGRGEYRESVIQTASLFAVRHSLPAEQWASSILHNVLQNAKSGENADRLLQISREKWAYQESGDWERWSRSFKSRLESGDEALAIEEISEDLLRSLWKYSISLSSSQRREQQKLGPIKFSDALQTLSRIGPSIAEEIDSSWKESRKKAKAVGFGFLYGMGHRKFRLYARDNYGIEVTEEEALDHRGLFFGLYPGFIPWHNRQRRFVHNHGYVRTLSGRKRRLPDAQLRHNSFEKHEAERQAINAPIQGFACELNLMAALQLRREFPRNIVRITGTVHDAILMRIRRNHVPQVYRRVLEIMSHPDLLDEFDIELGVPIEAEATVGAWGGGVSLEKWLKSENKELTTTSL
jgi:uracil-DNA glycosylase family 4